MKRPKRKELSTQSKPPERDKQDTVSSADTFVSHLNTTRVMRWLNELLTDTHARERERQTQRVLFRQHGQSGDAAGLVTPIRERVSVGGRRGDKETHTLPAREDAKCWSVCLS